jgi:hypothetical protein
MNAGKIIAVSQKQGRFPRVMEGNFQVIIGKLSITFLDSWKIVDNRRRTNRLYEVHTQYTCRYSSCSPEDKMTR